MYRKATFSSLAVFLLLTHPLAAGANPVCKRVTYSDIHALSKDLTDNDCKQAIRSGIYAFDKDASVNFKMSPTTRVESSHTVIRTKNSVVKLGSVVFDMLSNPNSAKKKVKEISTNRISLVEFGKRDSAAGVLVFENYCRASFSSIPVEREASKTCQTTF